MIKKKRPINMAIPSVVSIQSVAAVIPAKADPLLLPADVKA